jgi:hypothetical protein
MDREPASAGADNAGHRREPPIMLAEIIAARPFSILVEFQTRAISTPSTTGGFPRQKKYSTSDLIPRTALPARATCFNVRKGISKAALTEEQTFGDRVHGGKTLPKFADRGFSALQRPGPRLWLVY